MDFEVRKVEAKMFIFELSQPCPYGANPGVKFSVRNQIWGGFGALPPPGGRAGLGIFVAVGGAKWAKNRTKPNKKVLIFFKQIAIFKHISELSWGQAIDLNILALSHSHLSEYRKPLYLILKKEFGAFM